MSNATIDEMIPAEGAVVFHSPVTDLDGLPHEPERCGYPCRSVKLGMLQLAAPVWPG